jgi:hypothetical protein
MARMCRQRKICSPATICSGGWGFPQGDLFEPRPFPDALKRANSWRQRWPVFLDLVAETAKIGYYLARRWI